MPAVERRARADSRPYGAYAALAGTFMGGVGIATFIGARRGRQPPVRTGFDLLLFGLATFKAARTLAHDEVTSFIREPFVEGGPDDPNDETPVETGSARQAVGELVTCSRCIGTWVAAGIACIDVLTSRFGRALTWSLAVGGLNDWLQAGFSGLTDAVDRASRH